MRQNILKLLLLFLMCVGVAAQQPPPHFHIGKEQWAIKIAPFSDPDLLGETFCDSHTIQLKPGLSLQQEREVLVHELMHAAINSSDAEFICHRKFDEEDWCYRIEARMTQILSDNPQLYRFLLERKK